MALSPHHRPGCARLGIARLNAFRLNVYEAWAYGHVNGVNQGTGPGLGLMIEGASIQHALNEQPDTMSVTARGFDPVTGQLLSVVEGDWTDPAHVLFTGPILETTLRTEGKSTNPMYDLHAVDPTWLMGRQLVLATYVNQSASAIVYDMVAKWTRGVSLSGVQLNLPVIDAITFTNEQVPACLTAVCQRIGAYWFLDYNWVLHVFTVQTPDAVPITDATPRTSRNHTLREDLSQVITKVIGRGGGVGAAVDLPAGQTELPVDEGDLAQSWYSPTGGLVEVNTQRVVYSTVRGTGATGALVGTGNAPSATPRLTPVGGNTHTVGATYGYAVTFTTATGETLAGPRSAITIQSFNPSTPPAVAARGRPPGSYPPGLISPGANAFQFAVQIQYRDGAWGPLGTATGVYAWDGNDWEVYLGPRAYWTHGDGTQGWYFPVLEPNGPIWPVNFVQIYRLDNAGGAGWMPVTSDYFTAGNGWFYQAATGYGSGFVYPQAGFGAVDLYDIPISKAPGVTGRKVYRTTANGSALKLLTTLANNTATQYGDRTADAALGVAPPTSDTSGIRDEGQVLIGAADLPVSSTTPFATDAAPGTAGWVRVGGLVLHYTGIGAGVLTGIPASGSGAITAVIRYGAQVLVQPRLVGIPAQGTGALLAPLRRGDTVRIRIEMTDAAARDFMATRLKMPWQPSPVPEDGIIEHVISDSRFGLTELTEYVQATLDVRKEPHRTLTFESRDPSLQVGRLIAVTITKPSITGSFRIQRITFSELAITGGRGAVLPLRKVEATNRLYTLEDLLRQIRGRRGGVP